MNQFRAFTRDDAVRAAEAALGSVAISNISDIGSEQRRNLVLRASAVGADGMATPIIIKATRAADYDPADPGIYGNSGLVKEWAASKLLVRRAGERATFLAGDTAAGVLVFRDLGADLAPLVQPLLHGTAAAAEAALTDYAVALARLHAGTLGCRDEHEAIVRADFPAATVPMPGTGWADAVPRRVASLLGGSLPEADIDLMAERLRAPGPWLALVHRDPCPDNVLLRAGGGAEIIDFEFAAPGHALLEAAYWRMGFPTCWCAGRVPDAVCERLDESYRRTLAETLTVAADRDMFRRESAIMTVIWLLGILAWLLDGVLREDGSWGISTNRNRVLHYLEVIIEVSVSADVLPATRGVVGGWRDALRLAWPDSARLALYPAFGSDLHR